MDGCLSHDGIQQFLRRVGSYVGLFAFAILVFGINKEPYHATLTLPSQKADCKEIISLNGKWRFQWSADPGKRPADFYKNDFNTDTWDSPSPELLGRRHIGHLAIERQISFFSFFLMFSDGQ